MILLPLSTASVPPNPESQTPGFLLWEVETLLSPHCCITSDGLQRDAAPHAAPDPLLPAATEGASKQPRAMEFGHFKTVACTEQRRELRACIFPARSQSHAPRAMMHGGCKGDAGAGWCCPFWTR